MKTDSGHSDQKIAENDKEEEDGLDESARSFLPESALSDSHSYSAYRK
jgi:hypothetical protein